ncbi:MAG: TolC family protein [Microcoleaceae cyanobacterium]
MDRFSASESQSNSGNTRCSLPSPSLARWWRRLLLIGFATSGYAIAFMSMLSSRPPLEADAQYADAQYPAPKLQDTDQARLGEAQRETQPSSVPGQPESFWLTNPMAQIFPVPTRSKSSASDQPPRTPAQPQTTSDQNSKESSVDLAIQQSSEQTVEHSRSILPFNLGQLKLGQRLETEVPPEQTQNSTRDSVSEDADVNIPAIDTPTEKPSRPGAETLEIQDNVELENGQPRIDLTLRDTIILASENNRTIKNQYLERIVQRQDLAVAEDRFSPDFTPSLFIGWNNLEFAGNNQVTNNLQAAADLRLRVPTGGELAFIWLGEGAQRDGRGFVGQDDFVRQRLELILQQPLLRDAGVDVNRAPVRIARIDETINVLTLKQTLIDQITRAILAYRDLLEAQERLVIARNSLASAEQQVEDTQVLIDAGLRAQIEIITAERSVADQQVILLNAESSVKQQQLELLEILDLSDDLNLVAIEVPEIEFQALEFERVQQIALENQPDYLSSQLEVQRAKLDLLIAENDRRWNIDLSASIDHNPAGNIFERSTDFRAGIEFRKTLGDLNLERDFQRSRVDLLQAENNFQEATQQVNIEVEDRLREVNDSYDRVQLAQEVTRLAAQELANEEEKFRLGVDGTSILELVRLRDNLERTRNDELNAKIRYLNALTNLDQVIGTTLDTWNITIEETE